MKSSKKRKFFNLICLVLASLTLVFVSCEKEPELEAPVQDKVLTESLRAESANWGYVKEAFEFVQVQDNKLVLPEMAKASLKFNENNYAYINEHLNRINEQVLTENGELRAQEILDGKEYILSYQIEGDEESFGGPCCGTSKVKVTYTLIVPTGVTLHLNSCHTDKLVTLGCGGLGLVIGLIDGPVPVADIVGLLAGAICDSIVSDLLEKHCPCGVIIRASIAYQLEYVKCQSCGCSGCGGSNLVADINTSTIQEISEFVASDLNGYGKELISVFIKHQYEISDILESEDSRYSGTQQAFDTFWKSLKPLVAKGFWNHSSAIIESEHIEQTQKLLNELSEVVSNIDLQNHISKIQKQLPAMQGKNLKTALRNLDNIQQ